jgi:hypothetical protein
MMRKWPSNADCRKAASSGAARRKRGNGKVEMKLAAMFARRLDRGVASLARAGE